MWQVPIIAMTLTGGIWFDAASVASMPRFQYLLLLLAAFANAGLMIVLTRTRFVMDMYLAAIERFNPSAFVTAEGTGVRSRTIVAWTFGVLLGLSAVISLGAMLIVRDAEKNEPGHRRVIEVIEIDK
jgi:ABC-type Na+ efflux pump permease subunit